MNAAKLSDCLTRFRQEAVTSTLATPRYRLRYHLWGEGPPLVLIHGLNDIPRSFAPLMSHLARSFRCVAIHLPDGERDAANLHRYRHEHFTQDLLRLLDHLRLDRAFLLGSSFGSTIALRTAIEQPDRVPRLVIQGGFARRPLLPPEQFLARLGRSWPWPMGSLPLRRVIMRRLEAPAFVNAPEMIRFLIANSAQSPIRAVTHRARILETLDLRPLLGKVSQPLLMLGGDRDAIVPRPYEHEVEERIAHARRIEFTPCGHYPQYTHPDAMASAITEFLAPPSR